MKKWILILVSSIFILAPQNAQAEYPRTWHAEGIGDFLQGQAIKTAINADNSLSLSPELQSIARIPRGNFVSAAISNNGHDLYLGTSQTGSILKVTRNGNPKTLMSLNHSIISALTIGNDNRLYAASSPNAQIFRSDNNQFRPFYVSPQRYIWDMITLPNGEIYFATGDKGAVYRLHSNGQAELYFKSNESTLKTLYYDKSVGLLVGSGTRGIVYKIKGKGQAEALWDSPFVEISELVGDGKGNVFITALSPSSRNSKKNKSAVYWLDTEGNVDTLFSSRTESFLSLGLKQNGTLVVGTGSGRLFEIHHPMQPEKQAISLPARSRSNQVVKILNRPNGELVIVGNKRGQVEIYKSSYEKQASYITEVFSSGLMSRWGTLRYSNLIPFGTSINVQSRSGMTARPDDTWSRWANTNGDAKGSKIQSPQGRYLQLKFNFKTSNPALTPKLLNFKVSYLRRNIPPEVIEVFPLQRGIFFVPHSIKKRIKGPRTIELKPKLIQKLRQPKGLEDYYFEKQYDEQDPFKRMLQDYKTGMLTIAWDANDQNQDNLIFDLYYKKHGESEWIPFAEQIKRTVFSFDSTSLTDGEYTFRVYGNDLPSNRQGKFYRVFKDSELVTIDNTPPEVNSFYISTRSNEIEANFNVQDKLSSVALVEYSIDGKEFKSLQSNDNIVDAMQENFSVVLAVFRKGQHTLAIKATDRWGNQITKSKVFYMR